MRVVDTTFLIDLLQGNKEALLKSLDLDKEPIVLTTEANVYEVASGIDHANQAKRNKSLHELETLLSRLTVLPLDHKGALRAGEISNHLVKLGKMIDDIDCITAGIALTNGCDTIVTRNAKHFESIDGLKVESY